MSEIIQYTSADQLSQLFHANAGKASQLMKDFRECLDELNTAFGDIGFAKPFEYDITIQNQKDDDKIQKEMKRNAWRVLVGKMELGKIMSPKRRDMMNNVLIYGKDTPDNTIDDWPNITPENILDVLSGYAASANEFLDESIQDVYEFLKPWDRDDYKTNQKNRWRLSNKIIIGYAVECTYSNNYHLVYGERGNRIQALDTVFHLLDGQGFPASHNGPLYNAIHKCDTNTPRAETEYFKLRCCKNQNLHLEFKRQDLVDEFNWRCGNDHHLPGHNDGKYSRGNDYSQGVKNQPPLAPNGNLNFFATPEWLCRKMCDDAGITEGIMVLEPSAGLGHLAKMAESHGANVTCVEVDQEKAECLHNAGRPCTLANFLDLDFGEQFDAVLMNPPFSHKRDIAHIQHAWGCLKPGGVLVAVASSGVQYRQDKPTVEFRKWLDKIGGTVEELPENTFKESGTCVNTVLIHAAKADELKLHTARTSLHDTLHEILHGKPVK